MSANLAQNAIDSCGCCEGTEGSTPLPTANRPGLDKLHVRVGSHASFMETMLAGLSNQGRLPLHDLKTRQPSDPAIALLDAWATVADVLTFYNERIANEGYLRTATERRSVLELAQLVGYTPRPGVAATTYLAYTIDENTKEEVVIPVGARVQSVPGPGELPQTFETSAALRAHARLNNLKPRLTRPQSKTTIETSPSPDATARVYLKGINTNLKIGDMLLIDFTPNAKPKIDPVPYRIVEVKPDANADRTLLWLQSWCKEENEEDNTLDEKPNDFVIDTKTVQTLTQLPTRTLPGELWLDRKLPSTFNTSADAPLQLLRTFQPRLSGTLFTALANGQVTEGNKIKVYAPRVKAPLFGYNAQKRQKLKQNLATSQNQIAITETEVIGEWPIVVDIWEQELSTTSFTDDIITQLDGLKEDKIPNNSILRTQLKLTLSFQAWGKVDKRGSVWTIFDTQQNYRIRKTRQDGDPGQDVLKVYAMRGKYIEDDSRVYLDTAYDKILPGSWVVIDTCAIESSIGEELGQLKPTDQCQVKPKPKEKRVVVDKIKSTQSGISRSQYGLSGKTTCIQLEQDTWLSPISPISHAIVDVEIPIANEVESAQNRADCDFQVVRQTVVYAQCEELPLAEEQIETQICGSDEVIELDDLYNDLQPGRWLIISGERADITGTSGVKDTELIMLAEVIHDVLSPSEREKVTTVIGKLGCQYTQAQQPLPGDKTHTYLKLASPLAYCYKRDTVTIYGNVVKATHGETRSEVLGSGDGSKAFQAFTLKQPPLTYVPAVNPAGVDSSLEVRVNDVTWHEVVSQSTLGPNDRNFITKTDDEGKTSVIFGNGQRGVRPPTGVENIKARYRSGIGKGGNLNAGQLSLLMTRPLGVKEVINPKPATGGADRESRDLMRQNAPLGLMALDRLVSVRDYQDFSRIFAGIGKASAERLSDGQRQVVHVTVAGADDIAIDKNSDLFKALRRALIEFGDPNLPLQLAVRELVILLLSVGVRLLSDYQWESVAPKIRSLLLDTFGFNRRELGQDVQLSEVISAIHSVSGVAYVDVELFNSVTQTEVEAFLSQAEPKVDLIAFLAKRRTLSGDLQSLPRVSVNLAHFDSNHPDKIAPAQLAILTPAVPETLILTLIES